MTAIAEEAPRLAGEALDAEILRLAEQGLGSRSIGHIVGWSRKAIMRRLISLAGRRALIAARRQRVVRLAAEGRTPDQICAAEPGLSREAVIVIRCNHALLAAKADPEAEPDCEAFCDAHLADLLREHRRGCGELDIPEDSSVPLRPRGDAPMSLCGSPAGECAAAGSPEDGGA